MFDKLKVRVIKMAKKALSDADELREYETMLEGDELDDAISDNEKHLEILKLKRDGEGRPVHTWKAGQLPGAVKIRTCAGDASHESHWEKV